MGPERIPRAIVRGNGARFLVVAALALGAVGFLAGARLERNLPFAATAFLAPGVAILVPCLGVGWAAAARAAASALPALVLAHLLARGSIALLLGSGALLASLALVGWGLAALGARVRAGALPLALLVLAATASPWLVDGAIRRARDPDDKVRLASFALSVNPVAAAADLHGVDWLRRGSLYERFSIGPDVPYRYPAWERFAAGAALLAGLARLAAGRGRRPGGCETS